MRSQSLEPAGASHCRLGGVCFSTVCLVSCCCVGIVNSQVQVTGLLVLFRNLICEEKTKEVLDHMNQPVSLFFSYLHGGSKSQVALASWELSLGLYFHSRALVASCTHTHTHTHAHTHTHSHTSSLTHTHQCCMRTSLCNSFTIHSSSVITMKMRSHAEVLE